MQFVSDKAKIQISNPRRFGLAGVLATHAISFLSGVPVILAALALLSVKNLGVFNLFIPIVALVVVVLIFPFFGNAYVAWVVRTVGCSDAPVHEAWRVQITLRPRIRTGIRALIEDADDVGCLVLGESALLFRGDSVDLTIPFERIKAVHGENIGWRGIFVTAGRITLDLSGFGACEAIEIAERSSRLVLTSRKITRQMFERISARLAAR